MNTEKPPAATSKIETPVKLEEIDDGNKSSIIDANGKRIIVCNKKISAELIQLINAQHKPTSNTEQAYMFELGDEIWDKVSL